MDPRSLGENKLDKNSYRKKKGTVSTEELFRLFFLQDKKTNPNALDL